MNLPIPRRLAESLWQAPYDNVSVQREKPDSETATPQEIAEWCGIKKPRDELIPVDEFRETGTVRCSRTNAEPDPPFTIVANFKTASGEREVLSNEAYAKHLKNETVLTKGQARIYPHLAAGYSHTEAGDALHRATGTIASHASRINKQLRQAKATVTALSDF